MFSYFDWVRNVCLVGYADEFMQMQKMHDEKFGEMYEWINIQEKKTLLNIKLWKHSP